MPKSGPATARRPGFFAGPHLQQGSNWTSARDVQNRGLWQRILPVLLHRAGETTVRSKPHAGSRSACHASSRRKASGRGMWPNQPERVLVRTRSICPRPPGSRERGWNAISRMRLPMRASGPLPVRPYRNRPRQSGVSCSLGNADRIGDPHLQNFSCA